jgi:nicotinic acid phosphoribosyltransferase
MAEPVDMVYDVTEIMGSTIIDLSDEPEVIRKERKLGYSLDYKLNNILQRHYKKKRLDRDVFIYIK